MTDDPMLDGIQKYAPNFIDLKYPDQVMMPLGTGEYVLFSDLPALIAKVREEERVERLRRLHQEPCTHYEQGQRDEREACIARLEAIEHWTAYDTHGDMHACYASDPIAAIRAREEKP